MIRLETADTEPSREELIEAQLTDAQLEALTQMCDMLNVRRSCWLDVPALEVFETVAVVQMAKSMVRRSYHKLSMTQSLKVASDMLGCSYKTIEGRLHRAVHRTRKVSSELKAS